MTKLVMTSMTRSGHNFIKNNLMSWKKYERFLNLESENPKNHDINMKRYKINSDVDNVIVIRDLLNWLSSYLKIIINTKGVNNLDMVYDYILRWEKISIEAFNETNYIPDKIIIQYEDFKLYDSYRKKICQKIGGNYNEKMINVIPANGQYSSFDGNRFQNSGNKMKTEERYMYFINHKHEKVYLDILRKNLKIVELYVKYYKINSKQQEILNML